MKVSEVQHVSPREPAAELVRSASSLFRKALVMGARGWSPRPRFVSCPNGAWRFPVPADEQKPTGRNLVRGALIGAALGGTLRALVIGMYYALSATEGPARDSNMAGTWP